MTIVFEGMVRTGKAESYAEIARRAGLSRVRVSQVMRLLDLAPSIQRPLLIPTDDRWTAFHVGDIAHYLASLDDGPSANPETGS